VISPGTPAPGRGTEAPPCRAAFWGFWATLLLLIGGVGAAWYGLEGTPRADYSPAEWHEMERYAGTWRFVQTDGRLVRDPRHRLRIEPGGFTTLRGILTGGEHPFEFFADRRGRGFAGLLYPKWGNPGGIPLAIRLRFDPSGREMLLAVTLFSPAGRRDAILRAVKE